MIISILSVYSYPVPEGRSGAQVVEVLVKQVETLGGIKAGTFLVDCETYQSVMLNSESHKIFGDEVHEFCFPIKALHCKSCSTLTLLKIYLEEKRNKLFMVTRKSQ